MMFEISFSLTDEMIHGRMDADCFWRLDENIRGGKPSCLDLV